MKLFVFVTIISLCITTIVMGDEAHIFFNARINGQLVKLAFDTGASGPVLFRKTARRLNLKVQEPRSDVKADPGAVKIALTEKCWLRFEDGGVESHIRFAVIDLPEYINFDCEGILSWSGLKHTIMEIYPSSRDIKIHNTLTIEKSEWQCLDIRTDLNVLAIKISNEDPTQDCLLVDTGQSSGLSVRKELWQQWFGDTAEQNTTYLAAYTPGVGLVIDKEKWVKEINFGGLRFLEIPVKTGVEANQALMKIGIDGIVGIEALSCYSWIVDGPAGKIYLKKTDLMRTPEKYDYNRLGAVFVPKDIQTSDSLIAHVIKGGPAYSAGIRNGDVLLRIGGLDATKWRTNPDIMPLSRFWEMPAGNKVYLLLMRDGKKKEIIPTALNKFAFNIFCSAN